MAASDLVAAEAPLTASPARRNAESALKVYTVEEAAAILRVKQSWLERQAAARKVPFTMLGGTYRFTSAHLLEIVRLHEAAPALESRDCDLARPQRPRRVPESMTPMPLRPRPRSGPRRAS